MCGLGVPSRFLSWHLDSKTCGAHFLDSIIGDHKRLDHALFAFGHVDVNNYGAHHLDFLIGELEHLDHTGDMCHHKNLGSAPPRLHHRPPGSETPRTPLDTFRHGQSSYMHLLFSTISEVTSTCSLPCIFTDKQKQLLPINRHGFAPLACVIKAEVAWVRNRNIPFFFSVRQVRRFPRPASNLLILS